MLIDLIRGGAKTRLQPLNTRQSEAVTVRLPIFHACRALHHPSPRAFCTLPSFARIKRPRWRPVGLNDRHLRSNGKIGDCEQSSVARDEDINSCGTRERTRSGRDCITLLDVWQQWQQTNFSTFSYMLIKCQSFAVSETT